MGHIVHMGDQGSNLGGSKFQYCWGGGLGLVGSPGDGWVALCEGSLEVIHLTTGPRKGGQKKNVEMNLEIHCNEVVDLQYYN